MLSKYSITPQHSLVVLHSGTAARVRCQYLWVTHAQREEDKKFVKTYTSGPRMPILFLLIPFLRMQYPALSSTVIQISSFTCHFRSCFLFMHHFVAQCRSHLWNGFGCVMHFVHDTPEPRVPNAIILINCSREEIGDVGLYLKCFKTFRDVIHPQLQA